MPKIQRFTAVALAIFIITMLFILVVGMDFQDTTSFNTIFKKNPGVFWGATSIVLIAAFVIKYAETTYVLEVQVWLKKLDAKNVIIGGQNKVIASQNTTIIANQQKDLNAQAKHLTEVTKLNNLIIERAEKDNKKTQAINQIHGKINKLEKKRDDQLNRIKKDISEIKHTSDKNGKMINEIVKSRAQK